MSKRVKDKEVYNNFRIENTELFKDDEEKIYNFNCVCGNLINSIPNYEYWASNNFALEAISNFEMVLTAYYKLKQMGCMNVPKLSKLCRHTTYIKKLM